MNDRSLREALDHAHETHGDQPQAAADELRRRAPRLQADAEGAEAIRLGEHVWLGHLADAQGLRDWLALVPPALSSDPGCASALRRAGWALACLDGAAPGELEDGLRWRAMQNVMLAWIRHGDLARARALLDAEEPRAATSADTAALKGFAASANNLAADLRQWPDRSAARDALMLDVAALARRYWERAGTWLETERAEYQLAQCHAVLGDGPAALLHARACLAICQAHAADAFEHFFAHEALARACVADAQPGPAIAQRAAMVAALAGISEPDLRVWCEQALAALPKPLAAP